MKSKFTWILTLFLVFAVQITFAQEKTVTGVVTDKDYGDPIPGASVLLQGTNFGTETDMEGNYSIKAKPGDKLIVKYTGFKDAVVVVGASNVLNVTLAEDAEGDMLDDLVIDNYRTVAKPKSNVAASTVTSKTIEGRPNASFIQTLQAQVPGLNISTGSGQPGSANTTILLRGPGSINGSTEPLFIIDGVPMNNSSFRSINPNDIENVTVLKDAGATAIYGNRGANGVIVVTTKRGGFEQDLQVKYTGMTGISFLQEHKFDLMNSRELMTFEKEVGAANWSKRDIDNAPDTNWMNVFFSPAISQSHNLSFTGGSKNFNSFTSVGYLDQDGVLKTTGLKRFTFRTNMSGKSNDNRLNYSTTVNANYSKSRVASNLGTGGVNQNYVLGGLIGAPYISPSEYDGTWESVWDKFLASGGSLKYAPLMLLDKRDKFTYNQNEFKLVAQGALSYKLSDEFSAGTAVGVDYVTVDVDQTQSPYAFNSELFKGDGQEFGGDTSNLHTGTAVINANSNLKWEKTFNDLHEIKAGVFLEYQKAHTMSTSQTQNGLDESFFEYGGGTGWVNDQVLFYWPEISKSRQTAGLFSYFGTVDYDYNSKYGIGATVRRDASFRFTDDNRWGTFYSVSARWNIGNEDFMKESVFNSLKLRGSYGTAGNQDILGTGTFGASALYSNLYTSMAGYNGSLSYAMSQLGNRFLKWETIAQANIGLDFEVFNSRLRGSLDVYEKKTKDLYQSRPLSAINGTTSIYDNIGSLRNSGVELNLAGDIVRNENLTITLNANGAYNKNELLELPNKEIWNGGTILTGLQEGGAIGQYYLVPYLGVNPETGNLLFQDRNGNPTEKPTDDDRVWTGKSFIPKFQGGFGFDVTYKGFFANTLFSYVGGVHRYDNDSEQFLDPSDVGTFNKTRHIRDYWTPNNRYTDVPSMDVDNLAYAGMSDRFVKDASYVRLRYVSVGYNFKKADLNFMKLTGLRVYAQAENLYTWTKWKGFDAESNRGIDGYEYPTPRTVTFGVEVQF